ncbi:MAG: hypothetical protein ACRDE5_11730, partial [Ginsengibacter sp.]
NEVLAESNDAIPVVSRGLDTNVNPVKVFVEDKLITDEGYRTKYVLNENDAMLLPAIEVLKQKYFLRDDGKSIELTHDVLAPLIKDDREERRKEIALTVAKQKARKRAKQIIILSLIFSILVAGAIWFFTTKKAIADKAIAEKETIELNQSIAVNNLKLDSIKKRIDELDVNKNDTNKILALQKRNIEFEDSIKSLDQKLRELTNNKNHSDSMNAELLRNSESSLTKLKYDDSMLTVNHTRLNTEYDSLNKNFVSLKNENSKLNNDVSGSKNDYTTLNNQFNTLKNNYDNLKGDYDLLKRNFDEYKASKQVVATPDVQQPPADKNNLTLNLYSSKNENIPGNLTIYLIPDVSANKKIIRDSKTYDNHYDFTNLSKAEGSKTATYNGSAYLFTDVAPGDYFIKICFYYGPYKSVTKKAAGNETT